MLFFVGIAIVGAMALAISTFAGLDDQSHDLEHGDHDVPGIFDLKTISHFLIGTRRSQQATTLRAEVGNGANGQAQPLASESPDK